MSDLHHELAVVLDATLFKTFVALGELTVLSQLESFTVGPPPHTNEPVTLTWHKNHRESLAVLKVPLMYHLLR